MVGPKSETPEDDCQEDLLYKVDDEPPWYLSMVLGLQHYLTMMSGCLAMPVMLSPHLCLADDDPDRGHIISATFFAAGLTTFLQATFGSRLPIVQGPTVIFLLPVLAFLNTPQWKCPSEQEMRNMTDSEAKDVWMSRMREVQGAIIVGSVVEVLLGLTGLVGFLLKWITPLSVAPIITSIGLSLVQEVADEVSGNWWIATLTIILLIVFSQFMCDVTVPRLAYSQDKGFYLKRFPFFKLFSVIMTVFLSWGLCFILTATDVLSAKDPARTDLRLSALERAEWIWVPYPGQVGVPTFSIGPALGVTAGVVASALGTIGDYYACAKVSGAPPPPTHAVNRGIMVQGLGCVISGILPTGAGLTSFSENVGVVGMTKVGSRRVVQCAAVVIILFGSIGKLGALFIIIPSPVLGGVFCVMFALITGVGLSILQDVNLNSSRNVFIVGFSIFMGLSVPSFIQNHPDAIQTGNDTADQIIGILLKTSMFVSGFIGCLLDNTLPGSNEDRGLARWRTDDTPPGGSEKDDNLTCYELPFVTSFMKKFKFFQYIPISPTFSHSNIKIDLDCSLRKRKVKISQSQ